MPSPLSHPDSHASNLSPAVNPKLSLCMIVKNEEEFLDECLSSVRGLVDEIVIVDTGSTDSTVAIAERHGAKVFYLPWPGDFSIARNESLKHATGDWILVLDADEHIPEKFHNQIRSAIAQTKHVMYSLEIVNLNSTGDSFHVRLARLFRNMPEIRFEGQIHEQAITSVERLGLSHSIVNAQIIHKGYLAHYYISREKSKRNMKILLEQNAREPENSYIWFQMGQEYNNMGNFEEGQAALLKSLNMLKDQKIAAHKAAYGAAAYMGLLLSYETKRDDDDKVLAIADEALRDFPTYPDLHYIKGQLCIQMKRYEDAIKCFEKCRSLPQQITFSGNFPAATTYKPLLGMAVAYNELGKIVQAKRAYREAIRLWKDASAETYCKLGLLQLKDNEIAEAMNSFVRAIEKDAAYAPAWEHLGIICLNRANYVEAVTSFRQLKKIAPEHTYVDLLLSETWLKIAKFKEVISTYEERNAKDPKIESKTALNAALAHFCLHEWDACLKMCDEVMNFKEMNEADQTQAKSIAVLVPMMASESYRLQEEGYNQLDTIENVTPLVDIWIKTFDTYCLVADVPKLEQLMRCFFITPIGDLQLRFGRYLQQKGYHEEAVQFLMQARSQNPSSGEVHYLLAECAKGLDKTDDATSLYQTALELEPSHMMAQQKLAEIKSHAN